MNASILNRTIGFLLQDSDISRRMLCSCAKIALVRDIMVVGDFFLSRALLFFGVCFERLDFDFGGGFLEGEDCRFVLAEGGWA